MRSRTALIAATVILLCLSACAAVPAAEPTPDAGSCSVFADLTSGEKAVAVGEDATGSPLAAQAGYTAEELWRYVGRECSGQPDRAYADAFDAGAEAYSRDLTNSASSELQVPAPEAADAGSTTALLSVPISTSEGYQAVVNINQWGETSAYDTKACPGIEFPSKYLVHAIVISGTIEYPVVNGFTWVDPIELVGGAIQGSPVTQPSDPVVVATCATPASSPNSSSQIPTMQDRPWIIPPADEFAITILYASEATPNNPKGRFAEVGTFTQFLAFPNVFVDCAALNTNGFTGTDVGYCEVKRDTALTL